MSDRDDLPIFRRLLMHKQPLSLQAQVAHPGPVWLDRIDPASLALYGLGAEVQRAIEHRRAALRHIGIADDDPNRFAKVREIERQSVGKDLAASSRQAFVVATPDGFRGRVLEPHASPTGTAYTAVSDGQRLVLLKTNPSLRGLEGKSALTAPGWATREGWVDEAKGKVKGAVDDVKHALRK